MVAIEEVYTALRAKCGQAKESRLIEFYDRELKQGETIAKYASDLRTLLAEARRLMKIRKNVCCVRKLVKQCQQIAGRCLNLVHHSKVWI